VNARDASGKTPLHYAAASPWDSTAAATRLLDHHAAVNAVDNSGVTPLLDATAKPSFLELLLSRGARANAADDKGSTALHRLADSPFNSLRDVQAMALLCAAGLRSDVRDRMGNTALGIARRQLAAETDQVWLPGRRRIVQFLSPHGPCERLATSSPPASKEQREFLVAEIACSENDTDGCASLGWHYANGQGVAVNNARASDLYGKACNQGSKWACGSLGALYAEGKGVPEDFARAAQLYRTACDGGEMWACFNLAKLYATGYGVAKDAKMSKAWFRRACDGGDSDACENVTKKKQ
jgi:hypothetical protein